MAQYRLFADAACDIPENMLNEWGVSMIDMTFRFEGEEEQFNGDVPAPAFYQKMRIRRMLPASLQQEFFVLHTLP